MTEENKKAEEQGKENKFEKEQPLRHSLANMIHILINMITWLEMFLVNICA